MRAALCALAASTALVAGACAKKKHTTLYLPAEGTSIAITLDFPLSATTGTKQDFSYVCQDARSLLVSLDVGTSATPTWGYRFLFDLAGQLWGCTNAGPCVDQSIHSPLPRPSRIAVEGIDVSASNYALAPSHNVICRGVADSTIGMGTLTALPKPTPSPASAPPPPVISLLVSASVPVFRVGDMNGSYSVDAPRVYGAAVAELPVTSARSTSGGRLVFSGGHAGSSNIAVIHIFNPNHGRFEIADTTMAHSRQNHSSAGFLDSAGRPSILIVGGQDESLNPSTSGEVFTPGATPEVTEYPSAVGQIHWWGVTEWIPGHVEGTTVVPIVAVVGGGTSYGGTFTDQYEFFYPRVSAGASNCGLGAATGRPGFCRPGGGSGVGDGGQAFMSDGVVGGQTLWLGLGAVSGASGTSSFHSYLFNPQLQSYVGVGGQALTFGHQSVTLRSGTVVFFGGSESGSVGTSTKWGFYSPATNLVGNGNSVLGVSRDGNAMSAVLGDGRVLIASGDPQGGAVELFTPTVLSGTAGTFTFISRSIGAPCTTGAGQSCVRLRAFRAAGTTAGAISHSRSWLNGSAVIAGGGSLTAGAEVFVPAYACSGSSPIGPPDGHLLNEVDFCDRNRLKLPITSPADPSALSP